MRASEWLLEELKTRLAPDRFTWLTEQAGRIADGAGTRTVFSAFAAAARQAGKEPLNPSAARLAAAEAITPGWDPSHWTCAEAARAALLLALPEGWDGAAIMNQIYETADVDEAAALLKALPILPCPEAHLARAREGARNNAKSQFEAVALRNPYPAEHFDEASWNQMVGKALFVGSPLNLIQGLDRRRNPALARMLADHYLERKAAGRPHDPELWRCVGLHADDLALQALASALGDSDPAVRRAAALALAECPSERAIDILGADPELAAAARSGALTWTGLRKGTPPHAIR